MSDLHIKLIHERQKVDHQTAANEQLDSQLRDALKELKVYLNLLFADASNSQAYLVIFPSPTHVQGSSKVITSRTV